jgi:hypothetical protein
MHAVHINAWINSFVGINLATVCPNLCSLWKFCLKEYIFLVVTNISDDRKKSWLNLYPLSKHGPGTEPRHAARQRIRSAFMAAYRSRWSLRLCKDGAP